MLRRFKIVQDCGAYGHPGKFIILDRLKLVTCIRDKRYVRAVFPTREIAQGFLVAKTNNPEYANG